MGSDDVSPWSSRIVAPSIYDVAAAAGVSPSTVSRAFSRPGRVNAETASRILRVADELGYHRTPAPRLPTPARTSLIALVAADVTNSFFLQIIRSAQTAAAELGQLLLIIDTQESAEQERAALDRLVPAVDGLILGTSRISDSAIRIVAAQRPVVLLNRPMTDVPSLIVDNDGGMRAAVEHLAELGHETLTYVAGPEASWADGMRWHAARTSAAATGIRARRIGPFPPTTDGGRKAAQTFAARPTTSVVCYNAVMAMGMMSELGKQGRSVPGEVSIIGFDNIPDAADANPSLTTVGAPLALLGRAAVEVLSAQPLSGSAVRARSARLPVELVVRGSTGSPVQGRRRLMAIG